MMKNHFHMKRPPKLVGCRKQSDQDSCGVYSENGETMVRYPSKK